MTRGALRGVVCALALLAVGPPSALSATDGDGDGHPDAADNCPTIPNPGLQDHDRDGVGTACDDFDPRPGDCANPFNGTEGVDLLRGTTAGDSIRALAGDDTVLGFDSADCLSGGDGGDLLFGGEAGDRVGGGDDDDRLYGQEGGDFLSGGAGDDGIKGGGGTNRYFGRSGDDRIYADNGLAEQVNCGSGEDRARVDDADVVTGCERVTRS